MQVRIIPLADKGFIPISETNRVRYYIERVDNQKTKHGGFASYEGAKQFAETHGMEVIK